MTYDNNTLSHLQDFQFLELLDKEKNKTYYAQLIILDKDTELPISHIEGRVTNGSISINGNSAVRRTGSFTFVAEEEDNDLTDVDNLIAPNKKVKILLGFDNSVIDDRSYDADGNIIASGEERIDYQEAYGDIVWFKLGTFLLINPTIQHGTTGVTITANFRDKMCLLNGDYGGVFPATVTLSSYEDLYGTESEYNDETSMYEIIYTILVYFGNEDGSRIQINDLDEYHLAIARDAVTTSDTYGKAVGYTYVKYVYPGDLIAAAGDSVTSILDKICSTLNNYEYFYDVDGNFIFQEKRNFLNNAYEYNTEYYLGSKTGNTNAAASILNQENYQVDYDNLGKSIYTFEEGNDLVTSYANAPVYTSLKNDYIIWGTKDSSSSSASTSSSSKAGSQAIYYHLAVKEKPSELNYWPIGPGLYTDPTTKEEEVRFKIANTNDLLHIMHPSSSIETGCQALVSTIRDKSSTEEAMNNIYQCYKDAINLQYQYDSEGKYAGYTQNIYDEEDKTLSNLENLFPDEVFYTPEEVEDAHTEAVKGEGTWTPRFGTLGNILNKLFTVSKAQNDTTARTSTLNAAKAEAINDYKSAVKTTDGVLSSFSSGYNSSGYFEDSSTKKKRCSKLTHLVLLGANPNSVITVTDPSVSDTSEASITIKDTGFIKDYYTMKEAVKEGDYSSLDGLRTIASKINSFGETNSFKWINGFKDGFKLNEEDTETIIDDSFVKYSVLNGETYSSYLLALEACLEYQQKLAEQQAAAEEAKKKAAKRTIFGALLLGVALVAATVATCGAAGVAAGAAAVAGGATAVATGVAAITAIGGAISTIAAGFTLSSAITLGIAVTVGIAGTIARQWATIDLCNWLLQRFGTKEVTMGQIKDAMIVELESGYTSLINSRDNIVNELNSVSSSYNLLVQDLGTEETWEEYYKEIITDLGDSYDTEYAQYKEQYYSLLFLLFVSIFGFSQSKDWREEVYWSAQFDLNFDIRPDYYDQEMIDFMPYFYDLSEREYKSLSEIYYWIDYLEPDSSLIGISTDNLGVKRFVETNDNVSYIFHNNDYDLLSYIDYDTSGEPVYAPLYVNYTERDIDDDQLYFLEKSIESYKNESGFTKEILAYVRDDNGNKTSVLKYEQAMTEVYNSYFAEVEDTEKKEDEPTHNTVGWGENYYFTSMLDNDENDGEILANLKTCYKSLNEVWGENAKLQAYRKIKQEYEEHINGLSAAAEAASSIRKSWCSKLAISCIEEIYEAMITAGGAAAAAILDNNPDITTIKECQEVMTDEELTSLTSLTKSTTFLEIKTAIDNIKDMKKNYDDCYQSYLNICLKYGLTEEYETIISNYSALNVDTNIDYTINYDEDKVVLIFTIDGVTITGTADYELKQVWNKAKAVYDEIIKQINAIELILKMARANTSYILEGNGAGFEVIGLLTTDNSATSDSDILATLNSQVSAEDRMRELINNYLHFTSTITIQSIPVYYLDVNNRITVNDRSSGISGDYIIDSINLPLNPQNTMTVQATKFYDKY